MWFFTAALTRAPSAIVTTLASLMGSLPEPMWQQSAPYTTGALFVVIQFPWAFCDNCRGLWCWPISTGVEFFIYECIVLLKPAGNAVSTRFEHTCFVCAFSVTCINPWAGVCAGGAGAGLCCLVWAENGAGAHGAARAAVCAQEGKEGALEWRKVSLLFEITVPFGHDKSKEVEMNWIVVAPGCSGVWPFISTTKLCPTVSAWKLCWWKSIGRLVHLSRAREGRRSCWLTQVAMSSAEAHSCQLEPSSEPCPLGVCWSLGVLLQWAASEHRGVTLSTTNPGKPLKDQSWGVHPEPLQHQRWVQALLTCAQVCTPALIYFIVFIMSVFLLCINAKCFKTKVPCWAVYGVGLFGFAFCCCCCFLFNNSHLSRLYWDPWTAPGFWIGRNQFGWGCVSCWAVPAWPWGLCLSLPDGMKAERAAVAAPPSLTWSSLREIETGAMELSQNMRGASGAINCSS